MIENFAIRIFLSAFVLFAPLATAHAQEWYASGAVAAGYDSNPFRIPSAEPAFVAGLDFAVGYYPDESPFGAAYSISPTFFTQFYERSWLKHSLALTWDDAFGEDMTNLWGVELDLSQRHDLPEVDYYDYNQVRGSVYAELDMGDAAALSGGLAIRWRDYVNYSSISNYEELVYISFRKSFPTRTSLIARMTFGGKNYINSLPGETSASAGKSPDAIRKKENGNNGNRGNHYGRDWAEKMKESRGQGYTVEPAITSNAAASGQLGAELRIGQAIGGMTGISLELSATRDLSADNRAIVAGTVDYFGEEELFDDPYSYEKDGIRLALTSVVWDDYQIRAEGYYRAKSYSYAADFENAESGNRFDEMRGVSLGIDRWFNDGSLWGFVSSWNFDIYYIGNNSNSALFDYTGGGAMLMLGLDF